MNKEEKGEAAIMKQLHGKTIAELAPHWKSCIRMMFLEAQEQSKIRCHQVRGSCKTDVEVWVDGHKKNLCIKQGRANTVHYESIWSFVKFLRQFDISKKSVAVFLYYHFGDGTIKGDGQRKRMTVDEMRKQHDPDFDKANAEFQDPKLVRAMIIRSIIHGFVQTNQDIDYLYYGNEKFGFLASKEEIIDYLCQKEAVRVSTLSFGPLSYQPYARNIERDPRDETKRFLVLIKWPQMSEDMRIISEKRKAISLF
ncbi:MAG: hypothetical protein K6F32_04360 [Bacilli bacterium]|nr:hypothetical protein [Bacilli bacterium]